MFALVGMPEFYPRYIIDGVLGEGLSEKQIKRQVRQILMFDNWLEFQMQNGRKIVWQKQ